MNITIVQDTRQQTGKDEHVLEFFEKIGINVVRSKLYVGDYAFLHNMKVIVDRKKDVLEIAGNICDKEEHQRFKQELINAQEAGIKLYILIEDEYINNLDEVKYYKCPTYKSNGYKNGVFHRKGEKMSQVNFEALGKAMKTMEERYGCRFVFSKRIDFGAKVLKLLLESEKK
jgi:ERCC4-type nuclease